MFYKKLILFLFIFSLLSGFNTNSYIYWGENKKISIFDQKQKIKKPIYADPLQAGLYLSIKFYQKVLHTPKPGGTCPFYPTCSRYALISINKYGFYFGTLMIIDRLFYRENASIHEHYETITIDGLKKLTDKPKDNYIFNEK